MKTKQWLALVCAVLMMTVALCGCGQESGKKNGVGKTAAALTSASGKPGDTVEITLSMEENTGLWGFSWNVMYDNTAMTAMEVTFPDKIQEDFGMISNKGTGKVVVQGAGNDITDYTYTGEIATISFVIAENAAPGDYPITIQYDAGNNIDCNANEIPLTFTQGVVTVTA